MQFLQEDTGESHHGESEHQLFTTYNDQTFEWKYWIILHASFAFLRAQVSVSYTADINLMFKRMENKLHNKPFGSPLRRFLGLSSPNKDYGHF